MSWKIICYLKDYRRISGSPPPPPPSCISASDLSFNATAGFVSFWVFNGLLLAAMNHSDLLLSAVTLFFCWLSSVEQI